MDPYDWFCGPGSYIVVMFKMRFYFLFYLFIFYYSFIYFIVLYFISIKVYFM